jgi:hypothetical protein
LNYFETTDDLNQLNTKIRKQYNKIMIGN